MIMIGKSLVPVLARHAKKVCVGAWIGNAIILFSVKHDTLVPAGQHPSTPASRPASLNSAYALRESESRQCEPSPDKPISCLVIELCDRQKLLKSTHLCFDFTSDLTQFVR